MVGSALGPMGERSLSTLDGKHRANLSGYMRYVVYGCRAIN